MLHRIGRKSYHNKLLPKLLSLFPAHIETFIDLFMGSGNITFAMLNRAKFLYANDKEAEIFNLFQVVKDQPEELLMALRLMPIHESLFQFWRKSQETDSVWRAVRFLLLSNFSYLGSGETLSCRNNHEKSLLYQEIADLSPMLDKIIFLCCDFREVLSAVSWRHPAREKAKSFIYADPPYCGVTGCYAESFKEEDTRDLFALLVESGIRFLVSEYRHPVVIDCAQRYGLSCVSVGVKQALKSREEEIVVMNYDPAIRQLAFPV
jgi:DNA adenine methylase